jgi:hypothetical protein
VAEALVDLCKAIQVEEEDAERRPPRGGDLKAGEERLPELPVVGKPGQAVVEGLVKQRRRLGADLGYVAHDDDAPLALGDQAAVHLRREAGRVAPERRRRRLARAATTHRRIGGTRPEGGQQLLDVAAGEGAIRRPEEPVGRPVGQGHLTVAVQDEDGLGHRIRHCPEPDCGDAQIGGPLLQPAPIALKLAHDGGAGRPQGEQEQGGKQGDANVHSLRADTT